MTLSSIFYDVVGFLLSILVTGPGFMSLSWLVLELWQFLFIRVWLEVWKLEISPSKFCSISGDWGKLGIPVLPDMFLIKCYWMLRKAKFTAFVISKLLKKNQQQKTNFTRVSPFSTETPFFLSFFLFKTPKIPLKFIIFHSFCGFWQKRRLIWKKHLIWTTE